MNRRRFLTLSASAALYPKIATPTELNRFRFHALGAKAELVLPGSEALAQKAFERVKTEVAVIEKMFSLWQPQSSMNRLNRGEKLARSHRYFGELMQIADDMFHRTSSRFDPSVQVLWEAYSKREDAAKARQYLGWDQIWIEPYRQLKPGSAITMNGIAQGYAADKAVALLKSLGI